MVRRRRAIPIARLHLRGEKMGECSYSAGVFDEQMKKAAIFGPPFLDSFFMKNSQAMGNGRPTAGHPHPRSMLIRKKANYPPLLPKSSTNDNHG
jgi:hypothetical protein